MHNIILTGFMGTGKTAVGQAVACQLGRPFVDMDAEIEARAGKSIVRVFAEEGEAAFRQMEQALCAELAAQQDLVVSTGGGVLVNPANRAAMMQSGYVICLTCDPDEILRRLGVEGRQDRPLLHVPDPRAEIERLMQFRHAAYAAIPWQIDTTRIEVDKIVEQIKEIADMITLTVSHPEGQYEIHIGDGALKHVGSALRAGGVPEGSRVAMVSNPVVAPLYAAQVQALLRRAGLAPFVCQMPDGEPHKTLATVASLYDQFLAGELDRHDTVLALGGGVTGDVAGYAAATYMRGVRFAQVPTTLLAMVDSSVGGKTGVDLPQSKNLVGAFKQPSLVMIDPAALSTLPVEEFRSGMAEVIKHGVIDDAELFIELGRAAGGQADLAGLIARALRVKIEVVQDDPFEQGRRAVLNLGHTVGHALEPLSNFTLRHGEAVSIGLAAAARIAAELGKAEAELPARIESVLSAWGLPVRCPPFDADAILAAMTRDKKKQGRAVRWILPRAIGQVEIVADVSPSIVKGVLRNLGARGGA